MENDHRDLLEQARHFEATFEEHEDVRTIRRRLMSELQSGHVVTAWFALDREFGLKADNAHVLSRSLLRENPTMFAANLRQLSPFAANAVVPAPQTLEDIRVTLQAVCSTRTSWCAGRLFWSVLVCVGAARREIEDAEFECPDSSKVLEKIVEFLPRTGFDTGSALTADILAPSRPWLAFLAKSFDAGLWQLLSASSQVLARSTTSVDQYADRVARKFSQDICPTLALVADASERKMPLTKMLLSQASSVFEASDVLTVFGDTSAGDVYASLVPNCLAYAVHTDIVAGGDWWERQWSTHNRVFETWPSRGSTRDYDRLLSLVALGFFTFCVDDRQDERMALFGVELLDLALPRIGTILLGNVPSASSTQTCIQLLGRGLMKFPTHGLERAIEAVVPYLRSSMLTRHLVQIADENKCEPLAEAASSRHETLLNFERQKEDLARRRRVEAPSRASSTSVRK